jgi:hypothetical protein
MPWTCLLLYLIISGRLKLGTSRPLFEPIQKVDRRGWDNQNPNMTWNNLHSFKQYSEDVHSTVMEYNRVSIYAIKGYSAYAIFKSQTNR